MDMRDGHYIFVQWTLDKKITQGERGRSGGRDTQQTDGAYDGENSSTYSRYSKHSTASCTGANYYCQIKFAV